MVERRIGGVDTLPLLGIAFPLFGKKTTKIRCCSCHVQRDNEEEPGMYAKRGMLEKMVTFPQVVRKLQMCFHNST